MTLTITLTLLPMLLGWAGAAAPDDRVSSLVVQDQLTIRVPVKPPPVRFAWEQRDGPRCIVAGAIRGAVSSGSDHVDFITVRGRRFRAELEDECPALDFYGGLYLNPEDHRICAGRDVIRSRIGGSCRIEKFRQLVRKPRD